MNPDSWLREQATLMCIRSSGDATTHEKRDPYT